MGLGYWTLPLMVVTWGLMILGWYSLRYWTVLGLQDTALENVILVTLVILGLGSLSVGLQLLGLRTVYNSLQRISNGVSTTPLSHSHPLQLDPTLTSQHTNTSSNWNTVPIRWQYNTQRLLGPRAQCIGPEPKSLSTRDAKPSWELYSPSVMMNRT